MTCTLLFGKGHIKGVIVMVDEAAPARGIRFAGIAIGLSEARRAGGKVPRKKSGGRKRTGGLKKTGGRKKR